MCSKIKSSLDYFSIKTGFFKNWTYIKSILSENEKQYAEAKIQVNSIPIVYSQSER